MRTVRFVNANFYHVFNRGVEKRVIFSDQVDFRRFYGSMYLFNDIDFSNPAGFTSLRDEEMFERLLETSDKAARRRLVNIMSYCLLPNHFHMLLEQLAENGIPKFMHRLCMAYSRYFNKRYGRSGCLFEGTFKAVMIKRDDQLMHLPRYIHLNALDQTNLYWREGKIKDWEKAEAFLDNYPWSSHRVYKGLREPLPTIDLSIMRELFPTTDAYSLFLKEWSGRYISRL